MEQVSINLRKLKSHQASFLTRTLGDSKSTLREKTAKIKQVEDTQHVTKQLMDHQRKGISKNTWRQKKMETQPSKIYRTKEK